MRTGKLRNWRRKRQPTEIDDNGNQIVSKTIDEGKESFAEKKNVAADEVQTLQIGQT